jgi:hypothetical protein
MDCSHTNIIERCCNDCGMIVHQLEAVRGWNSQSIGIKKPQISESFNFLTSNGIDVTIAKNATSILTMIAKTHKIVLKGRRKKAFLFACVFDHLKCDIDQLTKQLNMCKKDVARGIDLYEQYIHPIKWTWVDFLQEKLKKFGLDDIFNLIKFDLTSSTSKHKFNVQMYNSIIKICKKQNIFINKELLSKSFIK